MDPVISVRNLCMSFFTSDGEVRALDGIAFDIAPGSTLGLVGESGCGKSATALSIMKLLPRHSGRIKSGEILFQGRDLVPLEAQPMRAIRGKKISMIFQDPMTSLNPVETIGAQIVEAILLHEPVGRRVARARAIEMLSLVGIPSPALRMNQYPFQLSGGMRQRVMIAMALCCGPRLLLADEPTTALDVTVQAQILDLLAALQRKFAMGVLLITHDLGVVAHYTDEVAVMYGGKIVERATTAALFQRPRHPYTQGLLHSIPGGQPPKMTIDAIPGTVPSALNWPSGCRFRTRCTLAGADCAAAEPPLQQVGRHHWAACFRLAAPSADSI
jgi:oligopeptide/dipeptide ABC transporter ATP-binding protein